MHTHTHTHTQMSSSLGWISHGAAIPEVRQSVAARQIVAAPPAARAVTISEETTFAVPHGTLTAWNAAMFLFHAALATTTLLIGNNDLTVETYKTRIDFQFVDVGDVGDDEDARPWKLVPTYEEDGVLPFTWLVAVFFLLSSLFHLLNITLLRSYYFSWLERCYTPTRWIEYSLSAPVMILLISYTLGIRSREVLLANFALVLITMPFGAWVEVVARPASADAWTGSLAYRLYPWVLGHIPQCVAWALIILQFYDGQDVADRARVVRAPHPLGRVRALLLLWRRDRRVAVVRPRYFYRGEILFQILSLVSKGILGLVLLTNVLMLSEFDDIYEDER